LTTRISKIRNRSIHRNTSNRKTEHCQSHIRNVAEDPNLGTYSEWGLSGVWLLINIFHIIWFQDSASLRPLSPRPRRPHSCRSHYDYSSISVNLFSRVAPHLFVSTTHQVIWLSPWVFQIQRKKERKSWYPRRTQETVQDRRTRD